METNIQLLVPKVYEAIGSIMAAIEPIAKNKKNTSQGYKFRGVDDVYAVLNPMLIANKVFIKPDCIEHQLIQFESKSGGALFRAIVTMKYTLTSWEDGSFIELLMVGEGMDSGDKATPKAQSIAYKYMAFQLFCIPVDSGDDVENQSHEVSHQQPQSHGNSEPKGNEPEKWLNDVDKQGNETPEWENLCNAIQGKRITSIADVRKHYKVSKVVAEKIQTLLNAPS